MLGGVTACNDPLQVQNNNQPDVARVYASPADVEALIGSSWNTVHVATVGDGDDDIQAQMLVMGLESYSGLSNFDMGARAAIPRAGISNQPNNAADPGNLHDWNQLLHAARSIVTAIQAFQKPGFSTGNAGRDTRNLAFAHFELGVALGDLALVYDSGNVVSPHDSVVIPPLVGHDSVMTFALSELDTAIALAGTPGVPDLPDTWLNAANGFTSMTDFIALAHSFKARFRAMVARTPAERDAVDWNAVIADAQAGIKQDYEVNLSPSTGWQMAVDGDHYRFDTWHSMPPQIIGMADVQPVSAPNGYKAWLAADIGSKPRLHIVTPDTRFPQGATRDEQVANSPKDPDVATGPYFKNRPAGDDRPLVSWANTEYDYYRFQSLYDAGQKGPMPLVTATEMDMLVAEGDIRTNQFQAAADLINKSREKHNLPDITNVTDASTQVPGGITSCVPQVPDPAQGYLNTTCGNLMEAMKWEKRMEDAYTGYGMWYLDGRGWGDLPEGTALEWPVPYEEMQVRQRPYYDLGGVGGPDAAAKSPNYGW